MALQSINPADGRLMREYPEHQPHELDLIAQQAHRSFLSWRESSFVERAACLQEAARQLRARSSEWAVLMAEEMGKPVAQGRAEAEKCSWVCDYYAAEAERMLRHERIAVDARESYVRFDPLGVVLAIMPWNFPFWQIFRCAAPTLMAGNAMILKHAANVSGCALAIEEIFTRAGFPQGLFRTVLVRGSAASRLVEHPLVAAVTLTGSAPAGSDVAGRAGALIKKCVLELGGSDPYLVLRDADLETAPQSCVNSRLINSGQSCIAAKRFIVEQPVYEAFVERFVELMKNRRVGDPLAEGTEVGPLARYDLREELHRQVESSIAQGAQLLLGGRMPAGPGAFYPPTVLSDVRPGMTAFDEELFGPVAALIPAADENEMVALANASPFGLGAAIYSSDIKKAERLAGQIESGNVFINSFVKSDPRLPFGGVKMSGYGRELSHYGIKEFVNIKTVYIS